MNWNMVQNNSKLIFKSCIYNLHIFIIFIIYEGNIERNSVPYDFSALELDASAEGSGIGVIALALTEAECGTEFTRPGGTLGWSGFMSKIK